MSNETWRERFDKEFPNLYFGYTDKITQHFCSINMQEKVKAFIQTEIEAAEKREREKASKLISAAKDMILEHHCKSSCSGCAIEDKCLFENLKKALKEYEEARK